MLNLNETAINKQSFPEGSVISSKLSSLAAGNLFQVHEFLCRFQEILGVEELWSFEELEMELSRPWLDNSDSPKEVGKENSHDLSNTMDTCGLGVSSTLGTIEMNCTKCLGEKLTTVHQALLPELVSAYLDELINGVCNKKDTSDWNMERIKLDMLPINQLTWPEVVRRCILAYLLKGGRLGSVNIVARDNKLFRCLLGDGGIGYNSPMGIAGADVDAQLLGRAIDKVFGKLKRESKTLSTGFTGNEENASDEYGLGTSGTIQEWVKVLEPVRKLPTNVGSRIRNCIRTALEKNPPEWAKKQLEASIAKDVYKGNASGPTKRAVVEVLNRVSDEARRLLPLVREEKREPELMSKLILKKCRNILRDGADKDNKIFSDLVGRNFYSDDNDLRVVFGSASTRPLDLRTIDLRLLHGSYGECHEAFLEDVKELWINFRIIHMNRPSLVKLADEMSKKFEDKVADLFDRKFTAEVQKEVENDEIPEASWETGICSVCGVNRDDTNVLLCDTEGCDAVHHTYCLNPPLSKVPEGDWHCPICAPQNQHGDYAPEEADNLFNIATAMEESEFWELGADEKTFLLIFLCDELLNTVRIRRHITQSRMCVRNELLGIDSVGRFYWGFPDSSTHNGIVVHEEVSSERSNISSSDGPINHPQSGSCGTWRLFRSDEEINSLVDYLGKNEAAKLDLRDSILQWQESRLRGYATEKNSVHSHKVYLSDLKKPLHGNCLAAKATFLLEAKYNLKPNADGPSKKARRNNTTKWHRCVCLEPILPSRCHCVKCHRTYFTNIEFELHKHSGCNQCSVEKHKVDPLGFSEEQHKQSANGTDQLACSSTTEMKCVSSYVGSRMIGRNFAIPESSLRPVVGKAVHILSQLKINLLDMEAALPDGAIRASRAGPTWRWAWCAFVKSANTIYEMVEATLVLESMIQTEYIKNSWWWYWSSAAAAAKISTLSALALRIYSLDAAIDYLKDTTSSSQQPRKQRGGNEKDMSIHPS